MRVVDLPLNELREAEWNPNVMSPGLLDKLKESVTRFGIVQNLVVRPMGETWQVLNGNQRLKVYRELGLAAAPCVVVDLDDGRAKLLAQALCHIVGEEDLGLRAEVIKDILKTIPQEEVLDLLPESVSSLQALSSLGQETIAEHLKAWEEANKARLHQLAFQVTDAQLEVVEEALARVLPQAKDLKEDNPNVRGIALYLLGKAFLEAPV